MNCVLDTQLLTFVTSVPVWLVSTKIDKVFTNANLTILFGSHQPGNQDLFRPSARSVVWPAVLNSLGVVYQKPCSIREFGQAQGYNIKAGPVARSKVLEPIHY
jgi:hypothetical protein